MKKYACIAKIIFVFSLIALLFSCDASIGTLACVANDVVQNSDDTLVMVYMAGGNNLSQEVVWDLNDMEVGLSKASSDVKLNMHIVALCDQYNDDDESTWSGTRLYEIQPDAGLYTSSGTCIFDSIKSKQIKTASSSLGQWRTSAEQEEDMGDIETLKNFIYWARETYPYCERQMLILWDHGDGIASKVDAQSTVRNVCIDEETTEDEIGLNTQLYIGEIKELLSTIYSEDNKLEFLGFDACYMGMYEVAYQFRDIAKYMAASPASETGGWSYDYILAQDSSCYSGQSFAVNAVTGYYKEYQSYDNTLSAYDLSKMNALKTAIDSFAETVCDYWPTNSSVNVDNYSDIDSSIFRSLIDNGSEFLSNSNVYNHYKNYYPYFELGSILNFFTSATSLVDDNDSDDYESPEIQWSGSVGSIEYNCYMRLSEELVTAAQNVQDAMSEAVLKAWINADWMTARYGTNIPYGMGIFYAPDGTTATTYKNWFMFYTDEVYTDTTTSKTIFGYGGIEAANSNCTEDSDRTDVNTWRDFVQYLNNTLGL
ncbi:MAG: hypothetical protein K5839_07630 [Treponemataceae bacterium]|nr:hypothetical protein [Treponemataceae bacterium]